MKVYVNILGFILGAALSMGVQAADVYTYQYGQKLDIAKVIKLDEPDLDHCDQVNASLTYQDSKGAVHTMIYRKLANICTKQG